MLRIAAALQEIARSAERQGATSGESQGPAVGRLISDVTTGLRESPHDLQQALVEGLADAARKFDHVSLAVTGLAWLGSGVPSVEQEMHALVRSAKREIQICAYAVTTGSLDLLTEMREIASQGVRVTIILNELRSQPKEVQDFLVETASNFGERWRLFSFGTQTKYGQLHAKIAVVDRRAALVGSANLSFHGMVSNHEMAVVVRGPSAEVVAVRIDMLERACERAKSSKDQRR